MQLKKTALKQTQSFFEQKCYSNVCQTVCLGIKCCEHKSSLVTELNKTEWQSDYFSQYTQRRAQNLSARLQGGIDVQRYTRMQTPTPRKTQWLNGILCFNWGR